MLGASVHIESLTKRFGEVVAVRGVSLDLRAGEFLSLLGASGSGKSTVLRMIAGLEEPSAGRITIGGREATGLTPEARGIGMVFQDYALFPHMTAWQNIAFPLRMRGRPRAEIETKVAAIMEMVGVQGLSERRPSQLSGGQQQRVALARALVFDPQLLLLDEPLSALDKNLRDYMKGELKTLHRRVGVTVVYVTHDQSEALALSDRVAVMRNGAIEGIDTPARLYGLPATAYIAQFIGDANLIDGEIAAVEASQVTIACPLGRWNVGIDRVRLPGPPAAGMAVAIVVRPESIATNANGAAGRGMVVVPCEVMESLYNGAFTLYALRSRDTQIAMRARSPDGEEPAVPPGGAMTIGVLGERAVIVARPA